MFTSACFIRKQKNSTHENSSITLVYHISNLFEIINHNNNNNINHDNINNNNNDNNMHNSRLYRDVKADDTLITCIVAVGGRNMYRLRGRITTLQLAAAVLYDTEREC